MPQMIFDELVRKYAAMNKAHPFMGSNGRSTRVWLDLILKNELKKCVDWSKISKTSYMNSMIISTVDDSVLTHLLKSAITDKINDRETFMKGIDYSYYYEE
jgi:cell filamentation protein